MIRYSKCLTDLYKIYNSISKGKVKRLQKETNGKVDYDGCLQFVFSQTLYECCKYQSVCDDVGFEKVIAVMNEMFNADLKGHTLHIFIESENLLCFLENLNVKDLDGVKKYIDENSEIVLQATVLGEEKTIIEKKQFIICLHLPNSEKGYVFSPHIENDGSLTLDYLLGMEYAQINSDCEFLKNPKTEYDEMDLKIYQLMLNTIMYMSCFPECVKNGLPKGFMSNSFRSKKIILSDNETVRQNVRLSKSGYTVTPHFRKAHFRYCGSDFYKSKKGKFIFIHGTMVNSKNVKTLIENGDKL